jgi:F-type H+-transporting ATPase subunit delta
MAGDITTIARPYASAVFARAQETGQVAEWSDALVLLAAIGADPAMALQIDNPNVPRDTLREIILEVAKVEGGTAFAAEPANLVRLLAQNHRLDLLQELTTQFEALRTAQQGLRNVKVRSAYPLSEAEQQALVAALGARLGGSVDLMVEQDPALIGGVEIRVGDLVIDGSIRGKLEKLAIELDF